MIHNFKFSEEEFKILKRHSQQSRRSIPRIIRQAIKRKREVFIYDVKVTCRILMLLNNIRSNLKQIIRYNKLGNEFLEELEVKVSKEKKKLLERVVNE